MDPVELWHAIIDAEAAYRRRCGHPARRLRLPVARAGDLATLRPAVFGDLAGRVAVRGIGVFAEDGLLGVPVELVPDGTRFEFV